MPQDYIQKSCSLKIKDMSIGTREVVVQHATYKSLDRDQDISTRGMFDKSWKENMNLVRFFLNHDKTQAPGKIIQLWDDSDGAYTKAKIGTHTLGDDVLKMLDEGIIQAVSYGAKPMKYKEIKGKGMQLLEVLHMETSVLTHWGAHDDSTVVDVKKSLIKDAVQLQESIKRMESFCKNTNASDESILMIQKEITSLKQLLNKQTDTADTDTSLVKCPKCRTIFLGQQDDAGIIKCTDCNHVLKSASQPNASSNKEDEKRKAMIKLKMALINS